MPPRTAPRRAAPARQPVPAAAPRWLRPVVLALAALLALAWFSGEVGDSDTWWHLKTGQFLLQQRRLPVSDPFAFTTYTGKPTYPQEETVRRFNLTHEWLAQILFYLAYAAGGFTGLVLFRALLLAAFCAVVGWIAWCRTGGFYRAVGAAVAAASGAQVFATDRPYLVTFLLLAVTIALVEARRFWILPPLFLLWANLHGGFFSGWLVLAAYCAASLSQRWRGRPVAGERTLWIASGLAVLLSGVNPNGFLVLPIMLYYRHSPMQSSLWEWQYPNPWPPSPFSVMLVAAGALLLWKRREVRPEDWLLYLGFGALSTLAVRNTILMALVGPIMLASYWPWKKALPAAGEWLAAAALAVGGVLAIAGGHAFQFRAADWKYPSGAADFLLAHHISGPLFNTYELGGYLIWRLWPEARVFIDGRALNETVYQDYQRIAFNANAIGGKTAEELLRQYGIETIVMDGFEYTNGSPYLLPPALSDPHQTEWKLVYRDAQAVIFVRHVPAGVEPLPNLDGLAALEAQCENYVEHDPSRPRCTLGLADLFQKIGDLPRAARWQARAQALGVR
ncbi:MAG TPA: hypothetical protein VME43_05570 [Bryobacteraceae bacterium]|nr:hypothetical protein [Bryobacteraceae bacterium]